MGKVLKDYLITVSHKATIENIVGLRAESEDAAVETVISMANTEGVEEFKIVSVVEMTDDDLEFVDPVGPMQ